MEKVARASWLSLGLVGLGSALVTLSWGLREAAAAPDCSRPAGALPDPTRPEGQADATNPVEHIIVMMQENHSFDNFLGRLNRPEFYGDAVDGVQPEMANFDSKGREVKVFRQPYFCTKDPGHGWDASHQFFGGGKMDGFVTANKDQSFPMGYHEPEDMPFLYELANRFAVGDRYFASVLGPTYPNRHYLFAATSFGKVRNHLPPLGGYKQRNIFDELSEHGISWKYYFSDLPFMVLFQQTWKKHANQVVLSHVFKRDLKQGTLPQVVFLESSVIMGDEHPPFNFQLGQTQVEHRLRELMGSIYWFKSAAFLTYDEGGGFFDHVTPPEACTPDDIKPELGKKDTFPADFDRLGQRVPFIAISPYAKRHYVSHEVYDHTSILRYIENKFNLPALSRRDANMGGLEDFFDYDRPDFTVPELPKVKLDGKQFLQCMNPFKKSGPARKTLSAR